MIDRWPVAAEAAADAAHVVRRRPDGLWGPCPASTRLTASVSARLEVLPSIVDPVLRSVSCELVAGHDDSHVAFAVAASGGERWWWLQWAADRRTLIEVESCG